MLQKQALQAADPDLKQQRLQRHQATPSAAPGNAAQMRVSCPLCVQGQVMMLPVEMQRQHVWEPRWSGGLADGNLVAPGEHPR